MVFGVFEGVVGGAGSSRNSGLDPTVGPKIGVCYIVQRAHLDFQYGIGAQKTLLGMVFGPNSILAV